MSPIGYNSPVNLTEVLCRRYRFIRIAFRHIRMDMVFPSTPFQPVQSPVFYEQRIRNLDPYGTLQSRPQTPERPPPISLFLGAHVENGAESFLLQEFAL